MPLRLRAVPGLGDREKQGIWKRIWGPKGVWHLSWEAHLSISGFFRDRVSPHPGTGPSPAPRLCWDTFQSLYKPTPQCPWFLGLGVGMGGNGKMQLLDTGQDPQAHASSPLTHLTAALDNSPVQK